jgi:hypothetical protein
MSRISIRKVSVQALQLRRKWKSMSRIYLRKVAMVGPPIKKKMAVHVKDLCKEGGSGQSSPIKK